MRQCERCGAGFEPSNQNRGSTQRFCTPKCRIRAGQVRKEQRDAFKQGQTANCPQCKDDFVIAPGMGRTRRFCSDKCSQRFGYLTLIKKTETRTCQCCYGIFVAIPSRRDRYCSKFCRGFMQEVWPRPVKRPSYEPRPDGLECDEASCTRPVIARGICATHYNKRKRQNNPGKEPSSAFRKRAKQWGVGYEPVDRFKVFERDEWICQLCLKPVDPLTTDSRWRASLDHVMPMSKGGAHTYANLQLAHVSCNSRKHAKVLYPGIPTLPPL